ncbi:Hypothetical predicted protein [Octopus vulgaris]|uniref:Uncharacterized protein n=1 Tax=Octopus vulgaris TaxID=6645 RepID=A0AA36FDD6_OCTVU|nr:Hypothetical predicted protein [Octopus vulgaris]
MCDQLVLTWRRCERNVFLKYHVPLLFKSGLADDQKDQFYEVLLQTTSTMNDRNFVIVVGDFKGHVGQHPHGVHGGYGFGCRNEDGTTLLESCDANDLMICHINFRKPAKPPNHLSVCSFSPDVYSSDRYCYRRRQSYHVSDSSVCYQLIKLLLIAMEGEDVFVGPEDEGPLKESATAVGEAEVAQVESKESQNP